MQKLWLVDVRTPGEFLDSHLAKSYNHPLSALGQQPLCRPLGSSGPLYLLCRDGSRARQAAERLIQAGQPEVSILKGGLEAWRAAGLPFVDSETEQPWLEALFQPWPAPRLASRLYSSLRLVAQFIAETSGRDDVLRPAQGSH